MKYNKLIPELTVLDFKKSFDFYVNALGFEIKYQRTNPNFAFIELDGSQLMIEEKHTTTAEWNTGELERPLGRGINFQITIKNIDSFLKKIKKKGILPRAEPKTTTYTANNKQITCVEFLILDPDGYLLRFCEELSN